MARNRTLNRFAIALLIAVIIVAVFATGLDELLTLEALKTRQQSLDSFVLEHRTTAIAAYFSVYVLVTALSILIAAVLVAMVAIRFCAALNNAESGQQPPGPVTQTRAPVGGPG